MVVEINKDIFTGNDFKGLNYLIQLLTYKQRYGLFVEKTLIDGTDLYNKLDEDDKKEIEENYNRIITEGSIPDYSVGSVSTIDQFNLEEAIRFLMQPVSIILENSLNDQYFINALIKHFDKNGDLKKHLANGWMQFENAGGCGNVENFINGKLQSFNNLSQKYEKSNHTYLRCFVLLDSDKTFPTMNEKKAYTALLPFLNANNVKVHILAKRCMENYMPDEVFDVMATTSQLRQWLNVYKNISETQKDYLNIETGFSKKIPVPLSKKNQKKKRKKRGNIPDTHKMRKIRAELDIEIQKLFDTISISDTNFEILDKGFKFPDFKTEFPKNFDRREVYAKNLKKRAGSNELQHILDKITELL
jgi:hypothetical protein